MDSNFVKLTVRAQYKFKASNNDELTFKKGDLITVTQKEDGGWWEGTSHETGKTGWFPSNYVKEVEPTSGNKVETAEDILAKQIDYRQQVIRDLIEKEREFVAEIEGLQSCYLEPLKRSEILSESEYQQLIGNTDELLEVHRCMHVALQDASAISGNPRDQRIGRVMLNHGSNVRASHLNYWANHPKAVCILEKYREELDLFMETHGASKPGLMVLTTSLSRPLRHLEKYAGTAQELEQHLEDDHPDRGDTQRSVSFYKNVASDCAKLRRQKELELEVLTGVIREWEGEEKISQLGEILHMGSVAVGPEHKDRYFVLFPATLVILSVSSRMSAFIYEGKLPLSGIAANRLEDIDTVKNSFEITGPMIDRIVVVCQSKQDSLKWVDILRNQIKTCRQGQAVSQQLPQPPQQLPFHHTPTPAHKTVVSSPATQKRNQASVPGSGLTWKMSCLRPAPPTRNYLTQVQETAAANRRSVNINKKPIKDGDTTYDDDMQILRVIESYCWSKTQRQTLQPTSNENIFMGDNFVCTPPIREDSHCYLLDHSCDESLGDSDEDDKTGSDNLNFRSHLQKIRGSACKTWSKEEDEGDTDWRDSVLSSGAESVGCASCTNLVLLRKKCNAKLKADHDHKGPVETPIDTRDSVHFNIGCLPKSKFHLPKCSDCSSSKAKASGSLPINNWCCGVGVISSPAKKANKKLD